MQELISRRRFLVASAPFFIIGSGAGVDAWAKPKKKSQQRAYYVLSPEYDRSARCRRPHRQKPGNCHGCKACHAHAKNKLFATARAANRNRAHKGCKCKVVRGGTMDVDTWAALFGGLKRPKRFAVDRRSKRTRRIMSRARRRTRGGRR